MLDFSFGIGVRQEEIKLRFWRNLNSFPRQQDEAITVKSISVMDTHSMDKEWRVFCMFDQRNKKTDGRRLGRRRNKW